MKPDLEWAVPPLSSDDQTLVDAYKEAGRILDDLPYTDEFDRLYLLYYGDDKTEETPRKIRMHQLWKRLLNLRKQGRLPRVG